MEFYSTYKVMGSIISSVGGLGFLLFYAYRFFREEKKAVLDQKKQKNSTDTKSLNNSETENLNRKSLNAAENQESCIVDA